MTDLDLDAQGGWDADWAWNDPIPDGVFHDMPDVDTARLPCCGLLLASIRPGDYTTADPTRVTCTRQEATT